MINNISIIGIGKLGLCFALTLEKSGYNVLGVDISKEYTEKINNKSLQSSEQGVEKLLAESDNFKATTALKEALTHSNILFVFVATPSLENGRYDHSSVDRLVRDLQYIGVQSSKKQLIIGCTTMPEYCDSVQERLAEYNYEVSYNPEFIAQGTILRDQANPDMVLIGEASRESGDILEQIYHKHTTNKPAIHRMSRTEAEICKISLNCFLTTKIAYANMIGDIALSANANPDKILSAIGSDSRIGNKYIRYGFGYGGPCFPRDNRALAIYAKDKGRKALISVASDESNKVHLKNQVDDFCKKEELSKPVMFDTVTYKPESTMLEESQQLFFAVELAKKGYDVIIREREQVIKQISKEHGDLFRYELRRD
jgi:UDPglucose 6-dehydrogenase